MLILSFGVFSSIFIYYDLLVLPDALGTICLFWLFCFIFIPFLDNLDALDVFYVIVVCLTSFSIFYQFLVIVSSYKHFLSDSS